MMTLVSATAALCVPLCQAQNSLTLSLSSNSVNFSLAAGQSNNPGSNSVSATTSWTLFFRTVSVYAYFNNASAALTNGAGNNIPSSAFFLSNNGGAYQALTNTVPFGAPNVGLRLFSRFVLFGSGSHTENMRFNINLSAGSLPQLPAGTYTGTLIIQAQAQ